MYAGTATPVAGRSVACRSLVGFSVVIIAMVPLVQIEIVCKADVAANTLGATDHVGAAESFVTGYILVTNDIIVPLLNLVKTLMFS